MWSCLAFKPEGSNCTQYFMGTILEQKIRMMDTVQLFGFICRDTHIFGKLF